MLATTNDSTLTSRDFMFELSLRQKLYVVLSGIFVASLLTADIVAGKYFVIFGLELSVGVIPFPIAFLLTDIVNEYYGRAGARFLTVVGMAMLVFAYGIIYMSRILPVSPHSPVSQAAMDGVFGISGRLFAASLTSYIVSQYVDIHIFHITKRVTQSKHLWLRALGSTAFSQVVDTGFVNFGALFGIMSMGQIAQISVLSYAYKLLVAAVLTPLCYLAHEILTTKLGLEPAPHENTEHPA